MGFFDSILGNASEVLPGEAQNEFAQILAPQEHVQKAYQIFRDSFIFTNKRLLLIDKQGLTGHKISYHSFPYRSITHFSIETAGHFDLDAELKIWIAGNPTPIQKRFNTQLNIYELQKVLAFYVMQ